MDPLSRYRKKCSDMNCSGEISGPSWQEWILVNLKMLLLYIYSYKDSKL